jgi:hypothetical protein
VLPIGTYLARDYAIVNISMCGPLLSEGADSLSSILGRRSLQRRKDHRPGVRIGPYPSGDYAMAAESRGSHSEPRLLSFSGSDATSGKRDMVCSSREASKLEGALWAASFAGIGLFALWW